MQITNMQFCFMYLLCGKTQGQWQTADKEFYLLTIVRDSYYLLYCAGKTNVERKKQAAQEEM